MRNEQSTAEYMDTRARSDTSRAREARSRGVVPHWSDTRGDGKRSARAAHVDRSAPPSGYLPAIAPPAAAPAAAPDAPSDCMRNVGLAVALAVGVGLCITATQKRLKAA